MESAFLVATSLVAGALLVAMVLPGVYRSPAAGLYLLSAPLVVGLVFDVPVAVIAGFSVDLTRDLAGMLLLAVGVARLLTGRRPLALWVVAGLGAFFAVALVRGILNYGISGHLEFSGTLLLLAGVAYGSSFQLTDSIRRSILRALLQISLVLIAASSAVWMGLGGPEAEVPAAFALIVAQTGVLFGVVGLERTRAASPPLILSGVLIGFTVLLQHRTVWAATLIAVVGMAGFGVRRSPRLVTVLAAIAILAVIAQSVGLLSGRAGFEADSLAESMQAAASDDRSLAWRQQYWRATLDTHLARGPTALIVGAGYGAPWISWGPLVDRLEGPHNQYIEFLVRFGILGGLVWIALLAWSARSLWRNRVIGTQSELSNFALLVVLLMQTVWALAYWIDDWQPVILGMILAAAFDGRPSGASTSPDSTGESYLQSHE